ncbi:putative component of type VI protein secretion system [Rhodopirellula rubra]|uniref:Putative component of type VI protein secretion system n=1 Tax=Aporhodopirellula rubra TaxID=980271 RepID=A0A7W5H401_9BACT|nr:hypothetical protein [Aporhodopirellula rubra]MBB3205822.1 putative component of type VI protein secretion system [Aporhodopirellula rubra]
MNAASRFQTFFSFTSIGSFALAALLTTAIGCEESSEPAATPKSEVQEYLDAHPELKEPKEDIAPANPTDYK